MNGRQLLAVESEALVAPIAQDGLQQRTPALMPVIPRWHKNGIPTKMAI
jgi:hypothetical protein